MTIVQSKYTTHDLAQFYTQEEAKIEAKLLKRLFYLPSIFLIWLPSLIFLFCSMITIFYTHSIFHGILALCFATVPLFSKKHILDIHVALVKKYQKKGHILDVNFNILDFVHHIAFIGLGEDIQKLQDSGEVTLLRKGDTGVLLFYDDSKEECTLIDIEMNSRILDASFAVLNDHTDYNEALSKYYTNLNNRLQVALFHISRYPKKEISFNLKKPEEESFQQTLFFGR